MGNKTRERGGPAPKGRRLPAGHSSAVSLPRLADRESLQGNHFKAAINYASMLCRGGGRESRRPAFLPATQASSRPNNKLKGRHNKKKRRAREPNSLNYPIISSALFRPTRRDDIVIIWFVISQAVDSDTPRNTPLNGRPCQKKRRGVIPSAAVAPLGLCRSPARSHPIRRRPCPAGLPVTRPPSWPPPTEPQAQGRPLTPSNEAMPTRRGPEGSP